VLHHCNSHKGLPCLPVLNGATGSLGNFPECLTARSSLGDSPPAHHHTPHAFVLLAAAASERAFGYTRTCSRSPIPHSPRFTICATAPGPTAAARSNCSPPHATARPRRSCGRTASPSRRG